MTDRPMLTSRDGDNPSACDVPSTSDASNRLSIVEEVPIPDHHAITETHSLAPQCLSVNTDQITTTTPSPTRSLRTKCESPSLFDGTFNSVFELKLRENLKTPENSHSTEANVAPSLHHLNLSSTSPATFEELRPFPKAARANFRK
ncbi:unnamed protein product [Acanthoscelides obtectus]|uniref:Uncharacterized protein n=1 Tax=Acanthoscelides obtectus TaxID=200917 RepID=A0A9P0NZC6_ACAOB|nr:unnamed protein product [Acanthoscelides obtectus]CAK1679269.1 hypothetical protein AOBTE_LOCUS32192 [Acanthoscelides obtectus]